MELIGARPSNALNWAATGKKGRSSDTSRRANRGMRDRRDRRSRCRHRGAKTWYRAQIALSCDAKPLVTLIGASKSQTSPDDAIAALDVKLTDHERCNFEALMSSTQLYGSE